ncbi:MAG: hypothetical protein IRY94_02705, partial [Rhodospirillaceae bacterium]|nr:hypothetical protein [Rhodospirillaceae bacterium]
GFLFAVQGAGPGHAGRLGSRGTAHVFPYGAEHFAGSIPAAAALAARWRRDHAAGRLPAPADVDDRYFAYFYLPQFALAWAHAAPTLPPVDLVPEEVTTLPGAGLVVVRRRGWSATVSTRLGGALAVQREDGAPAYLLGYEVGLAGGGGLVSHHWQAPPEPPQVARQDRTVTVRVRSRFAAARRGQPLVRWAVPFRALTRLLACGRLAEAFHALIKRRMVNPRPTARIEMWRSLAIGPHEVAVRDEIRLRDRAARVTRLAPAGHIAPHSPSARQDPGEALGVDLDADAAARLVRDGRLVIERRFNLSDGV